MKETAEAEELDERDDEDEDEAVPVESESYVNLRKKMVTKHSMKMDNLLQENGKLCREFQKKQVKRKKVMLTINLYLHQLQHNVFLMHHCPSILLFTQSSRRFRSMLEQRRKLPAWQEKENILDLLDRCQVLVVSGMTGWVTQDSLAVILFLPTSFLHLQKKKKDKRDPGRLHIHINIFKEEDYVQHFFLLSVTSLQMW